jgi:hypothetical protein
MLLGLSTNETPPSSVLTAISLWLENIKHLELHSMVQDSTKQKDNKMIKNKEQVVEIRINRDVIKDKKLMIATPMYGGNCAAVYLLSLVNLIGLAQENFVNIRVETVWNDALVSRARNDLVDKFLKSDYDYFMFIDGDIQFNPHDILYMLQIMVEQEDKEILVGTYPKKLINWEKITTAKNNNLIKNNFDYEKYSGKYVVNFKDATDKSFIEFNLFEPVEILDGGTGFMMIKRDVFEKFKKSYPEQIHSDHNDTNKKITAYFDCKIDPIDNVYLSEDYMFTRWTKKIGIKTWLLPWIKLSHQGTYVFNGDFYSFSTLLYDTEIKTKKKGKKK